MRNDLFITGPFLSFKPSLTIDDTDIEIFLELEYQCAHSAELTNSDLKPSLPKGTFQPGTLWPFFKLIRFLADKLVSGG